MSDTVNWDTEVELTVRVRVNVQGGPECEGSVGRTPEDLAMSAVWVERGGDPSRMDGYVDLVGHVGIVDVSLA